MQSHQYPFIAFTHSTTHATVRVDTSTIALSRKAECLHARTRACETHPAVRAWQRCLHHSSNACARQASSRSSWSVLTGGSCDDCWVSSWGYPPPTRVSCQQRPRCRFGGAVLRAAAHTLERPPCYAAPVAAAAASGAGVDFKARVKNSHMTVAKHVSFCVKSLDSRRQLCWCAPVLEAVTGHFMSLRGPVRSVFQVGFKSCSS